MPQATHARTHAHRHTGTHACKHAGAGPGWGGGKPVSTITIASRGQGLCPWQVVVWKRYSDFRKLHGDLAYTHRNLFRRLEEFPAFPRAQVFGEC